MHLNDQHLDPLQGYQYEYNQYGQGNRAYFQASQPQASPWQTQPYETCGVGQEASTHYLYAPTQGWANEPHLSQTRTPPSNDFDLRELQELSTSANDAPWTVQRAPVPQYQYGIQDWSVGSNVPKAHNIGVPDSATFHRSSFTNRPSFTPSLGDSAYVSAAPLSVDFTGVDEPTQANAFRQSFRPTAPLPTSIKSKPVTQKRRRPNAEVPPCSKCGRTLKNHTEANKHRLQHTRPFVCKEPGCTRIEGFATENDLERHRKSVHRANPRVGKTSGYICQACPTPSPGEESKWWPRYDNFKAHIERKHREYNVHQLVAVSERSKPDDAFSDQGYGSQRALSHPSDDQAYQHDLPSPIDQAMSRHASHQGDFGLLSLENVGFEHQIAGVGAAGDQFHDLGQSSSHFYGSRTSIGDGMAVLHDAAVQQLSSPQDSLSSIPEVHVKGESRYDKRPGEMVIRGPSPKRRKLTGTPDLLITHKGRSSEGNYICKVCGKHKKRACDLRKHYKRHTRPYGCTFPNCTKRFGSLNDWKRHENSQHFLKEMWRCEIKVNGEKCGELVYHEDTFAQHLQRKHGVPMYSDDSKVKCRSMHLGREGHYHFWCGFCNTLIEQPDSMEHRVWDMRFKHIGEHYDKKEDHIDQWIDIEENKMKCLITTEGRTKFQLRSKRDRFIDDDDSDLGDANITEPFIFGHSAPTTLHAFEGYETGFPSQAGVYMSNRG